MDILSGNNNINFLKIFLSLIVMARHLLPFIANGQPESYVYFLMYGLSKLSVPLFLIITGYYIGKKADDFKYILGRVKKILIIFIVWQVVSFYFAYQTYKEGLLTKTNFYLDIFYGFGHLWYLSALILSLFLIYFTNKFSNRTKLIVAISLLIISYFLQYNNHLRFVENKLLNNFYIYCGTNRNFLFYAFPYLLLGTIYDYWKKYLSINLYFGYTFFLMLLIFELSIYYHFKSPAFNLFVSAFPLTLFIFNHIINLKNQIKFSFPKTLSIGIYLIHPAVLYFFYTKSNIMNSYSYTYLFVLLLFLTILFWYFLDKINKKIKIFF